MLFDNVSLYARHLVTAPKSPHMHPPALLLHPPSRSMHPPRALYQNERLNNFVKPPGPRSLDVPPRDACLVVFRKRE